MFEYRVTLVLSYFGNFFPEESGCLSVCKLFFSRTTGPISSKLSTKLAEGNSIVFINERPHHFSNLI